jgi:PAS domain S-box-containing protein
MLTSQPKVKDGPVETAATKTDESAPSGASHWTGNVLPWLTRHIWAVTVIAPLFGCLLYYLLGQTGFLPFRSLTVFPLLGVIFVAYVGGLAPGLAATALCLVPGAVSLILAEPTRRPEVSAQVVGFLFVACVASIVCDRRGPGIARIEEERRRAEESAAAARAAEQRLHLLLDGIKDYAIALLDTRGTITAWNAGGIQVQGWSADEIIGQPCAVLFREEERTASLPEQVLGTALREGRCEREGWLVRSDGQPFRAHLIVAPVADEAERVQGFTLVATDITERVRVAEERERLLARVQEADLWQRTFLREVLYNVTEGRLRLCDEESELPEVREETGETFVLDRTTLNAFRNGIRRAANVEGFSQERLHDLLTAAHEVAMNAVVHAGGGTARIHVSAGKTVQVWVEDQGTGMALGTLHRATLEKGYTTAGTMGYGWFLALRTIDRVWLHTGPSGTTIVLEQDICVPNPVWATAVNVAG